MSSVTVKMKDGSVKEFKHQGRSGGSYTVSVKYEGAFVVIEDEWYKRTAIPASEVSEVIEIPTRF